VNLHEVARAVNARVASTPPRALSDAVGVALARPWFLSALISGFAAIAFAIALVGIYSLVAYGVSSRVHEIGIRVALGASRLQVVGLAGRQLARTLVVGVPMGLAAGWLLSRWMAVLLYDVRPWEPMSYALVAISLAVTAVVATIVPLRRAMRVDPLVALRAE
jgi:putative ABC transport system permease protein